MCWSVYVIRSEIDARLYKGMTQDVNKRVHLHNLGKVRSTKGYKPWNLVYVKECADSEEARAYEKFLKSAKGRDFLKVLLR